MLKNFKQIKKYNLLKQTGYTQMVALSVFKLCFPKKRILILPKPENKSKHKSSLSLVVFAWVVSFLCSYIFLQYQFAKWLLSFYRGRATWCSHPSRGPGPCSRGVPQGCASCCRASSATRIFDVIWRSLCCCHFACGSADGRHLLRAC